MDLINIYIFLFLSYELIYIYFAHLIINNIFEYHGNTKKVLRLSL